MPALRASSKALTRFGLGFFFLFFCLIQAPWAFVDVPKLSSRVTDLTGTLSSSQAQDLESKLAAFEQKKGSQIAVLIVPTTQPEDIAEFGIKVADLWRVGRKDVDDGLIFIVAKDDRKMRLEVGYGLEGVIPDAIAKRVIAETVTPYFKAGDFAGGINAGVDQLISLIEGEKLPEPAAQASYPEFHGEGLIFALFGGLFAGSLFSSLFGRVTGGLLAGVGTTFIASLFLGFGLLAIILGIIVFFLTSSRFPGGGGWSSGGGGYYGGGGFGGGSWGSGSWSGGGGGFGGGGASGQW